MSLAAEAMAEGQGSPGSASAGPLTGEEVLSRLAVAVDRLAQSASSGSGEWRESKRVKQPEVFNPKSIDEEIAGWQEWSFVFKNFMSVQDERFREDFNKAETASSFVAFESYEPDTRARALRLYSVLAGYLKGRPLKLLKSVVNGDGFRVWRQLTEELQPASRPTWRCLRRFLNIQRVVGKHPSAIAADRKVGRFLPASNLSLLFMVGRTFLAFGDAHRTFVKFMAPNVSLRCGTYLWI